MRAARAPAKDISYPDADGFYREIRATHSQRATGAGCVFSVRRRVPREASWRTNTLIGEAMTDLQRGRSYQVPRAAAHS